MNPQLQNGFLNNSGSIIIYAIVFVATFYNILVYIHIVFTSSGMLFECNQKCFSWIEHVRVLLMYQFDSAVICNINITIVGVTDNYLTSITNIKQYEMANVPLKQTKLIHRTSFTKYTIVVYMECLRIDIAYFVMLCKLR